MDLLTKLFMLYFFGGRFDPYSPTARDLAETVPTVALRNPYIEYRPSMLDHKFWSLDITLEIPAGRTKPIYIALGNLNYTHESQYPGLQIPIYASFWGTNKITLSTYNLLQNHEWHWSGDQLDWPATAAKSGDIKFTFHIGNNAIALFVEDHIVYSWWQIYPVVLTLDYLDIHGEGITKIKKISYLFQTNSTKGEFEGFTPEEQRVRSLLEPMFEPFTFRPASVNGSAVHQQQGPVVSKKHHGHHIRVPFKPIPVN